MSEQKLVNIEINGQPLQASAGKMLIDVADEAGIDIPRFCYHKRLSVAASCRMCLVEVAGVPKPLPACATPINEGMKVLTRSPKALDAQRGTLEFLLINHPLDCPICDQGGECELQDLAVGYGDDCSRFVEGKRVVRDENLGPLIASEMTRCIHCTRCVRFGEEIAGVRELGATGRGEHMRIGTYVAKSIIHELSGNVIDLCPVGALTSKPFRFTARAWELIQAESISPHDAVGANLYVHVRRNQVMRVHPKVNESVNECWIADRDRFSYQGLYSPDRLTHPMVKRNDTWHGVSWQTALEELRERLSAIAPNVSMLISPQATIEEHYLATALLHGLGSQRIDHRLRQVDFRADGQVTTPWLGMTLEMLEQQKTVLAIGMNPRHELPLVAHRLRKAVQRGAVLGFLNPIEVDFTGECIQTKVAPSQMVDALAALAAAVGVALPEPMSQLAKGFSCTDRLRSIAASLNHETPAVVLLGDLAQAHPDYALLQGLASQICQHTGATLGYALSAGNSVGAHLAGAVPFSKPGGSSSSRLGLHHGDPDSQAIVLFGFDPDHDVADASAMQGRLADAKFVAAVTSFRHPVLEASADILLPLAAFTETSGTYVNLAGQWQSFAGVAPPFGDSRPGWKILRVIGQMLQLPAFDQQSSADVLKQIQEQCAHALPSNRCNLGIHEKRWQGGPFERVGMVPLHASDPVVRRAKALAQTELAGRLQARIHPSDALASGLVPGKLVNVKSATGKLQMEWIGDPAVVEGTVLIPAGIVGAESVGPHFTQLELSSS